MFVCKSGDTRKTLVKVPKIYVNLENPTEVAVKLELVQWSADFPFFTIYLLISFHSPLFTQYKITLG